MRACRGVATPSSSSRQKKATPSACVPGRGVMLEDTLSDQIVNDLIKRGHERVLPPAGIKHRALMGGGQAIMIDPVSGALSGASDPRKDGLALGY